MKDAMEKITTFVRKIAEGGIIDNPAKEGYFKRGVRKNVWKDKIGAIRAVDMLLAKISGEHFETELPMPKFSKVVPSPAIKDLSKATIAVMTSGGIVPKGNPHRLEALSCTKYHAYTVEDFGDEELSMIEVAHGGYDPTFALGNGNRVLPIDALLELERRGEIGKAYPNYYVTVGNSMPVDRATMFGDAIAKELKGKVDGVILTST
jgi:betaine reductase